MTENKRFTYENHKVKDNLTDEVHSSNMVSVNVLNTLHEENTKLKSENEMLRTTISRNEAYIDRLKHQSEWSNHSEKVKLEDIIGMVKTEEVTNSVELKKELYK